MSKAKNTKSTQGKSRMPGPMGIAAITIGAIAIVGILIYAGGGLPSPTDDPTTSAEGADDLAVQGDPIPVADLVTCNGQPCPSMGSPDAPVTLIEVSEFGCSHCIDHNRDVAPMLEEAYVDDGTLRVVSHIFAISPSTQFLSSAALCAAEQEKYFEFQHEAFTNELAYKSGPDLTESILAAGEDVGLEADSFKTCVEGARYMDDVQQSTTEAQRAGLQYTPTFVLNGLIIEGGQPLETFRQKIEQAAAEEG